ncbi:MAG: acyltransferase domain-containing protein, partial [Bacteroidales bacterium]|nr:acyltransferase domain-containing protein [Bacteroidales bacterium]
RGSAVDTRWTEEYGNKQRDIFGKVYEGTILEHLLLQNLCSFYEVGDHNHIRLRGADWNDALDMAEQNGESVAFTCAYAGNLKQLAKYIRILRRDYKMQKIELLSEMVELLGDDAYVYDDISKKLAVLKKYVNECEHQVSGARVSLDSELVATNLDRKAEWIMRHVSETEWVTDGKDHGWFNSYYDNHGRQVEGAHENGVRMMLTGQVFALMSRTATHEQAESIVKAAKEYLFDAKVGGYKINTDFKEEKYDMGRMFGFAYGEKENGAVFSHMTVMFANALYQNGFIREGYEALNTLSDTALNFDVSYMYPGIPEYFNASGRGMYSYLTGAASWYMLTMVTEVFGARGEMGNFTIDPKLVKEQFDESGIASIQLMYADKNIKITYKNEAKKDYGAYKVAGATVDGKAVAEIVDGKVIVDNETIKAFDNKDHDAAGALSFEDGLKLVYARAMAMQKACEAQPSTMAAVIALSDDKVEEICDQVTREGEVVVAANYNCPGQIVISGTIEGINRACELMKEAGAKRALPLKVGGAFHSPLMDPAKVELEAAIQATQFNTPKCPVYQNVDALPHTNPEEIKTN